MTKRTKINLFAALIVAGGGASLYSASPAHAASAGPCERLAEAQAQEQSACESKNGTYSVQESYCTATGWGLKSNCMIVMT